MPKKPRVNPALNDVAHDIGVALHTVLLALQSPTVQEARERLDRFLVDITLDADDTFMGPFVAGVLSSLPGIDADGKPEGSVAPIEPPNNR